MTRSEDHSIRTLFAKSRLVVAAVAMTLGIAPSASAFDAVKLASFRQLHGDAWQLTVDPESGRPRRLAGGSLELISTVSSLTPLERRTKLESIAHAFLVEHATMLGLDADALRPSELAVVETGSDLAHIGFDFAPNGVPVIAARVQLVVKNGRLLYVHAVGTRPVTAAPDADVRPDAAVQTALAAAELNPRQLRAMPEPTLAYLPTDDGHRLIWQLWLTERAFPRRHLARVDAVTGELVWLTDETVSACAPSPPGGPERRVLGGVRPEAPGDVERQELLPSIDVSGNVAGKDGHFTPPPLPYSAGLTGPDVVIDCFGCANPTAPLAPANSDGDIDFADGGANETGNGFATPADRAVYFHSEAVRRYASRWLAIPFVTTTLTAHTNLDSACNAFWDGSSVNFFRSSSRCGNTGESRDVIQHEWGHGLDQNDGLPSSPLSVDGATGEAAADFVAMLRSRDPCMGEGFFNNPADGPSAVCSGVRDLNELSPGHEHGAPATLDTTNALVKCPPSAFYRGPLGREGHCEGEIFGQTGWHLAQNLITGLAYDDGTPLPDGALGDEAAWQLMEALFFRSRPTLASYAPMALQSIGPSAYDAFLLADDEGDGIGNGTPHAAAIHQAFSHHGIAEQPTAPTDTLGCIPPPDPGMTLTAVVDPSSGLSSVQIDWTDVGAIRYHVLRADDPDDAYLPIASPFGLGAGTFVDRAVFPGRFYRYRVVAEDGSGCLSPATVPAIGSPGPYLRIATTTVDDSTLGNNNGLLEEGETADLLFELANDGSGPASSVQATLLSAEPQLVVLAPGPIAYGTIVAGGSVPGPAAFRVQANAGVPRFVLLQVDADATEGCLRARTLMEIAVPVLTLDGHAIDDSVLGDNDTIWEAGETVDLIPQLRNVGLKDADPVTSTLRFRGAPPAGVTIDTAIAAWPLLVAGGPALDPITPFTLTAGPVLSARTRVLLELEVQIGGILHDVYDINLTIGGFPPGMLEWSYGVNFSTVINYPAPIVLQLDDDTGDNVIDECDTPDIVLLRYEGSARSALVAVSGATHTDLWEYEDDCTYVPAFGAIAGGDVDNDGLNEIVVAGNNRIVCVFSNTGVLKWQSAAPVNAGQSFSNGTIAPTIWDLDGDGAPEIVTGFTVLRGSDGSVVWDRSLTQFGRVLVGDLDLDGQAEVISEYNRVYRADGSTYPAVFGTRSLTEPGGLVNLDGDPYPEVVLMSFDNAISAYEHDGTLIWSRTALPGARGAQGPPCFGDFDRDGLAEVAVATEFALYGLDHDGTTMWTVPSQDSSGSSGCTVFDFGDDGIPEIVYRDEYNLMVVDAVDGSALWQTPMRNGTAFEVPIIVDVDHDGSAEILSSTGFTGSNLALHVYGNPNWPSARPVWNQEAYSGTHVTDTGAIVANPLPSWLGDSTWRGQSRGQDVTCLCGSPTPSFTSTSLCNGTTVCFQPAVVGGTAPFTYEWDFGDGSPVSTATSPCHGFPGPGDYGVQLRVVDDNGCWRDWGTLVTVRAPLSVDYIVSCAGPSACLNATSTGGVAPIAFEWDLGDGSPRVPGALACHAFPPGVWNVTLFGSDANGCLADISYPVTADTTPQRIADPLLAVEARLTDIDWSWTSPSDPAALSVRLYSSTVASVPIASRTLVTSAPVPSTGYTEVGVVAMPPDLVFYQLVAASCSGALEGPY